MNFGRFFADGEPALNIPKVIKQEVADGLLVVSRAAITVDVQVGERNAGGPCTVSLRSQDRGTQVLAPS